MEFHAFEFYFNVQSAHNGWASISTAAPVNFQCPGTNKHNQPLFPHRHRINRHSIYIFLYVFSVCVYTKINEWINKDIYSSSLSSSVKQGVKYQYTIQVEADGFLSDPSPPLLYTHGQPYCGDGRIQGSVTVFLLHLGQGETNPKHTFTCFTIHLETYKDRNGLFLLFF